MGVLGAGSKGVLSGSANVGPVGTAGRREDRDAVASSGRKPLLRRLRGARPPDVSTLLCVEVEVLFSSSSCTPDADCGPCVRDGAFPD
jgi:hypothetical protein